jgi:hypothetical protein
MGGNACTNSIESWDGPQALVDTDRFGAKSIVALSRTRSLPGFLRGSCESCSTVLVPLA